MEYHHAVLLGLPSLHLQLDATLLDLHPPIVEAVKVLRRSRMSRSEISICLEDLVVVLVSVVVVVGVRLQSGLSGTSLSSGRLRD